MADANEYLVKAVKEYQKRKYLVKAVREYQIVVEAEDSGEAAIEAQKIPFPEWELIWANDWDVRVLQ